MGRVVLAGGGIHLVARCHRVPAARHRCSTSNTINTAPRTDNSGSSWSTRQPGRTQRTGQGDRTGKGPCRWTHSSPAWWPGPAMAGLATRAAVVVKLSVVRSTRRRRRGRGGLVDRDDGAMVVGPVRSDALGDGLTPSGSGTRYASRAVATTRLFSRLDQQHLRSLTFAGCRAHFGEPVVDGGLDRLDHGVALEHPPSRWSSPGPFHGSKNASVPDCGTVGAMAETASGRCRRHAASIATIRSGFSVAILSTSVSVDVQHHRLGGPEFRLRPATLRTVGRRTTPVVAIGTRRAPTGVRFGGARRLATRLGGRAGTVWLSPKACCWMVAAPPPRVPGDGLSRNSPPAVPVS